MPAETGGRMSGLVESATAIMRMAERRLDVVAHNVANIATPGYKRRIGFADIVANALAGRAAGGTGRPTADALPELTIRSDGEQGKLQDTGDPFDLAISGPGYFRLRAGDATLYTRQGQFHRDPDGLLVTPQGYALQQAGGGDLVIEGPAATIAEDGTVTDSGRPVGRVALERAEDEATLTPVGESFFTAGAGAMSDAETAVVRQGMVEASNVSLGDEMTQSMAALRQAETGARLIQLYDDLMGRAVTAFAGGGR